VQANSVHLVCVMDAGKHGQGNTSLPFPLDKTEVAKYKWLNISPRDKGEHAFSAAKILCGNHCVCTRVTGRRR